MPAWGQVPVGKKVAPPISGMLVLQSRHQSCLYNRVCIGKLVTIFGSFPTRVLGYESSREYSPAGCAKFLKTCELET